MFPTHSLVEIFTPDEFECIVIHDTFREWTGCPVSTIHTQRREFHDITGHGYAIENFSKLVLTVITIETCEHD